MRKKTVLKKIFSFAIVAVMLFGVMNFAASAAAAPIVIDFSKYDNIDDIAKAAAGDGDYKLVQDGTRYVLYAECIVGFDPADPDGTGTKGDPNIQLVGFEDLGVNADTYKWMKMSVKNESNAPGFEVHFSSPSKSLSVETSITFDITPNSDYTSYIYNVTDACKKYYPKRPPPDVDNPDVYPDHWNGLIDIFRLDFMYYEESGGHARAGDKVYVEYIAFFESEQDAKDFVFVPAKGESPTQAPEANDDSSPASGDTKADENNNMMIIIIICAAAVVVIIIVVVIVLGGKKKKK